MSTTISSELRARLCDRFGSRVRFDEPLAPYVAYRVGGPADALVFPSDEEDLVWLADLARETGLPITTIGTGTNLLVRDEGIRGVTVSLHDAFQKIEIVGGDGTGETLVRCGGGVQKADLLEWALERSLAGLVFSAGVPGTVGGGLFMNAGTKYGCYGDILRRLRLFDFGMGARELTREQAHFGYRHQSVITSRTLVAWAELALTPGDGPALRAEVARIIAERAAKQPLDFPSCGSTFKNPEGHSAGRLIERSGLKGSRVGGAEISTKHANFILNKDGATAADILALIQLAKNEVYSKFGVHLECEVIVVGGPGAQN